jgi:hypothetical protein
MKVIHRTNMWTGRHYWTLFESNGLNKCQSCKKVIPKKHYAAGWSNDVIWCLECNQITVEDPEFREKDHLIETVRFWNRYKNLKKIGEQDGGPN